MATQDAWREDWQLAFPHKYIGAPDLRGNGPGRDVTLTISRVELEELQMFRAGKTERKKKLVLYFRELEGRGDDVPSMLLLNKTNAKTIADLYGRAVDAWVGKRITMYRAEIEAFGKSQEAVRIRPKVPSAKGRQSQPPGDAQAAAGPVSSDEEAF